MLTIVTLNWARPGCTIRNLEAYSTYTAVNQIICFNNGPRLKFTPRLPPKCLLVEASENVGVSVRMAMGALAATPAILHTDDDLLLPESTIYRLLNCWQSAPLSCHGIFGRRAYPRYVPGNIFGAVEVVLTRALMCSPDVNNRALSHSSRFEDLGGVPRGNGEDIMLSFAAMSLSGTLNFAHQLPVYNYENQDAVAIHQTWSGHFAHRQRVVEHCRQIFARPH
jgi:hypothetical protein